MERSGSFQPSTLSESCSTSSLQDICRFCLCEGLPDSPLISPCHCAGSIRYVHLSCLRQWIKTSHTRFCELCRFYFIMHLRIKPLRKWKKLEMSEIDEQDLLCTILNLFILISTVISFGLYQYSMIEDTKQYVHVNICRSYFEIDAFMPFTLLLSLNSLLMSFMLFLKRWKVINSIIYVQNAPENTTQGSKSNRLILHDFF